MRLLWAGLIADLTPEFPPELPGRGYFGSSFPDKVMERLWRVEGSVAPWKRGWQQSSFDSSAAGSPCELSAGRSCLTSCGERRGPVPGLADCAHRSQRQHH